MTSKKEIGDAICAARKKMGLSQKELGDALGISDQSVSGYETGKKAPSFEMLTKICTKLKISLDKIYGITSDAAESRALALSPHSENSENPQLPSLKEIAMRILALCFFMDTEIELEYQDRHAYCFLRIEDPNLVSFFERQREARHLFSTSPMGKTLYKSWMDGELADLEKKVYSKPTDASWEY